MNLTSPWTIPYQLLWAGTGYDPLTPLTVEMTNLEDKMMTLDFLVLTTDETTLSSLLVTCTAQHASQADTPQPNGIG